MISHEGARRSAAAVLGDADHPAHPTGCGFARAGKRRVARAQQAARLHTHPIARMPRITGTHQIVRTHLVVRTYQVVRTHPAGRGCGGTVDERAVRATATPAAGAP